MIDAVLIAGPTASGKSAIASRLAELFDGVVINADSMQVYSDLRIITARPTIEEEAQVPHRLYGTVDGAVNYSVGHYLKDIEAVLGETRQAKKLAIIIGGTGLYFKALLEGLSAVPPVPDEVRETVRKLSEELGQDALYRYLAERDPEGAKRLQPADSVRVQRALEVFKATGRTLSSFHDERVPGLLSQANVIKAFLNPDREKLKSTIDLRFEKMMDKGTLDEVRVLKERNLDPMLPIMRAHGVPGLIDYLNGLCSLADAVIRGQADTRRYSKRQFTWFRHQMSDWQWLSPEVAMSHLENALKIKEY
ncbi:tRNA (adenosine(37)-N6)-dimethylallyltransferase MiaA [Microvirga sp. W0021]|uniref:tRNA dimethylallyltransferase n=1 Tax=Hohaiivirga grylli TaxID=3133970 RepID=A0ABV0BM54_9HYPH